jgi:hypothetical protein
MPDGSPEPLSRLKAAAPVQVEPVRELVAFQRPFRQLPSTADTVNIVAKVDRLLRSREATESVETPSAERESAEPLRLYLSKNWALHRQSETES